MQLQMEGVMYSSFLSKNIYILEVLLSFEFPCLIRVSISVGLLEWRN